MPGSPPGGGGKGGGIEGRAAGGAEDGGRLKKFAWLFSSVGGGGRAPGSPGTGAREVPPCFPGAGCCPCDLPHMIFSRRPLRMSLLKERSAAVSADARAVKQTNAQFCLGTIVMDRSSPNW